MLLGVYPLGDPPVGDAPSLSSVILAGDIIPLSATPLTQFWPYVLAVPIGTQSFDSNRVIQFGATVLFEAGRSLAGFNVFNLFLTGPMGQTFIGNSDAAYAGQIPVVTDIGPMDPDSYVVYPLPGGLLTFGIWTAYVSYAQGEIGPTFYTQSTTFTV